MKFRLKNGPIKGKHTIIRGKQVIHLQPGDEITTTREELGGFAYRFEEVGQKSKLSSIK